MNREKSVKLKTCIFENINNIGKTLARLNGQKRGEREKLAKLEMKCDCRYTIGG